MPIEKENVMIIKETKYIRSIFGDIRYESPEILSTQDIFLKALSAGVDFTNCDFSDWNLSYMDMLVLIDFTGSNFYRADMSNSYIMGSNFSYCNCYGTNFNSSNLAGTKWRKAFVFSSNFYRTNLKGAKNFHTSKINFSSLKYRKYIFVGGLHRSGTSIIGRRLAVNQYISGFDSGTFTTEGQFHQDVYDLDFFHGGPGKFAFSNKYHKIEEPWFNRKYKRNQLLKNWSSYWDMHKILLEKTPGNLLMTRFLQSLFTNSYFLIVYRHPIVTSLATQKWSGTSLINLVEHWLHAYSIFNEDKKYLNHYKEIKYEEFVYSPYARSRDIYEWMDIPMICSDEKPIVKNQDESYLKIWEQLRNTPEGIHIVGSFESEINKFGYSFNPPYYLS